MNIGREYGAPVRVREGYDLFPIEPGPPKKGKGHDEKQRVPSKREGVSEPGKLGRGRVEKNEPKNEETAEDRTAGRDADGTLTHNMNSQNLA